MQFGWRCGARRLERQSIQQLGYSRNRRSLRRSDRLPAATAVIGRRLKTMAEDEAIAGRPLVGAKRRNLKPLQIHPQLLLRRLFP